jgi:NTE family protein
MAPIRSFWPRPQQVNLALQGGGAHGAFTWGVLDYLLERGHHRFEGASGTSAGAVNAVVLAHGLMCGGPDGAREALARFWTAVANSVPFELITRTPDGKGFKVSPALDFLLDLTHYFSPAQLNPFALNPLRSVVEAQIDFERLRADSPLKLFIAATRANSGTLRIFRNAELSADAVLASACLPTIHHAIEIDGEPYWDGGYSANPAIFPLFYECRSPEILLVLLSPSQLGDKPQSAREIRARAVDIAFNNAFRREMAMIQQAREFAGNSLLPLGRLERRLQRLRFHLIDAEHHMASLPYTSKLAAHLPFFETLRDMGRARARRWLRTNRVALGRKASLDPASVFG